MTYPSNQRFAAQAEQCGWQPTVAFDEGDHDWAYWDRGIARVLTWLTPPGK
ncbi:hypothetical protein OHA21_11750 [Actinoplanes sp. NBC_00393]|uniref:hypothetical protein n=1 Tax=Actinoplanes sp. NBC_00393 TaxID=2975953 RepID=UPI002E1A0DC2